jgi:hypothetical protein
MAKPVRKGNSTRKPPAPLDDHGPIDEWLSQVRPDLQPVVRKVDEVIRSSIGEPIYGIKWNKAYYGSPDQGWLIELVAYIKSVNIVFLGGADFESPPPLGEGHRSRYVKIESADEVDAAEIRGWIEEAARTPGWK